MKLYHTPGGTWAGTEKAYNAAMKAEGLDPKTASRKQVEVPTSKAELMEFLTFYNVRCIQPATPSSDVAPQEAAPQPPTPPAAGTTIPDLDAAFAAAPLPRQLALAVGAIDRADAALRRN